MAHLLLGLGHHGVTQLEPLREARLLRTARVQDHADVALVGLDVVHPVSE